MKKILLLLTIAVAASGCKIGYVRPDDNYQTQAYIMLYDSTSRQPHQLSGCYVEWIQDISPNNQAWTFTASSLVDDIPYLLLNGTNYYASGIKCTPILDQWNASGVVFTKTKSLIKSVTYEEKTYFDTLVMDITTTSPMSGYAQKIWINGELRWDRDTCSTQSSARTPILNIYHNVE